MRIGLLRCWNPKGNDALKKVAAGRSNEWYKKDTSKKVRAVFCNKGMSGKRICGIAPYGYIKDENGDLVIDEETAPIVKQIFQLCAEGNGPGRIARILSEREIAIP